MEYENYIIEILINIIKKQNIKLININNKIILINNEPWLWNNIKKLNKDILIKFVDLRIKLIDILINNIFKYFNCSNTCIKNVLEYDDNSLYSNYDLTIINPSFKTSIIIQMFNSIIFLLFNNTPNLVFDTNLYTYSFLLNNNLLNNNLLNNNNNNNIWKSLDYKFYYLPLKYPNKDQDIWALLKLYTFDKELIHKNDIILNFMKNEKIENLLTSDNEYYYTKNVYEFEQFMKNNKYNNINKVANILSHMNYHGENTYITNGAYLHVIGSMFYYKDNTINNQYLS